jgi:hypothetical protein
MKLTSWPSAAFCALAMMLTAAPALASGALDGKRFDGVFMERGKTSGDADTLTFRDGRFRSSACDKYGYSDAAYKASTQGDTTVFEAETESAKYGKLLWKGTVRGEKLDATVMSIRSGKAPVENWVVAAEKK